jgi:hypothetical protein
MIKSLFKTLMATSLVATAFAAQSSSQPATKTAAPAPAQMDPNPSARWGTNDSGNFFVTGEAVWFKPLNDVTTQTITESDSSVSYISGNTKSDVSAVTAKWAPAFRLAIGYNTSYDGWDSILTFTDFQYKHNSPYELKIPSPFSTSVSGTTSVRYYYYQGDLDFGRMFKVSSKLRLRPHVGIRSIWLSQKTSRYAEGTTLSFQTESNGPYASTSKASLKGTLAGAEFGLDSVWMLSSEFSVYANATASTLVYGRKYHELNKFGTSVANIHNNNVVSYNRTNYHYTSKIVQGLDFAIGLRWDKNIYDGDYHIGINFGYEHHNLINLPIADQYGPSVDFTMQGLALGARFDF